MKNTAYQFSDLTHLVSPRSIAVVGASDTPGSIGTHTMDNLLKYSKFKGAIYPINPKRKEVAGLRTYAKLSDLPSAVDVVLVVVPDMAVVPAVREAAAMGCKFAMILSSGFGESDAAGKEREEELKRIAAATGIRIYGPNCPGLVNVVQPLGMTFSPAFRSDLRPGTIGLATQGGGLGRNIIQNMERGAGFTMWASTGNECDLEVADFIHYLAHDPQTDVIVILIEGFQDGSRFAAACLEAKKRNKPVIGLKVGKTSYGAQAAQSHTASITGSPVVNSTALRDLGVIEVADLDELVDVGTLFSRSRPKKQNKLAIFASSGGAATLCADAVGESGATLAELTPATTARLRELLPAFAAIKNPIDITSIAITNPELYKDALAAVGQDPNVDLVVVPMPLDYGPYTEKTATAIVEAQAGMRTPAIPVWMSERQGPGYVALARAGLTPIRSLRNLRNALERWGSFEAIRHAKSETWVPAILTSSGRKTSKSAGPGTDLHPATLTEYSAKQWLKERGLQVALPVRVGSVAEIARAALDQSGSYALKIDSPSIVHKTDVGGVRLDVSGSRLQDEYLAMLDETRRRTGDPTLAHVLIEPMVPKGGAEIFVSITRDRVFGPVLTVGLGGVNVELFKDVVRTLLPLEQAPLLTRLRQLKSFPLLNGYRGQAAFDLEPLVGMMLQLSRITLDAPELAEVELNPVWLAPRGGDIRVLDAVVTLAEATE